MGGYGMGGLGVHMHLGDVLDLVVDVGSDLPDNWGSHHLLTDLVDRHDGLVDGLGDSGNRGSSIGNSGGSSNSWSSSIGGSNSWGSSIGGSNSWGSSYSSKTSVSSKAIVSSKTAVSSKTISREASIASGQEASISISCGSSKGDSCEGRQSNE